MVFYIFSLLSKAVGITLPLVLLILDIYPLGRLGGGAGKWFGKDVMHVWWEKLPFLVIAIITAIVAVMAQREATAMKTLAEYGMRSRLAQALFGLVFYLWKTVLPLSLFPLYELSTQVNLWDWSFIVSGAVVVVVSLGLFLNRGRWPGLLTAWLCYAVIVAPALGVAQSGPQYVADRYSYVSCLPWAVLAGAGAYKPRNYLLGSKSLCLIAGALLLVGLGHLSWTQAKVWHDAETLWRYTLALRPNTSIAHYNLGLTLEKQGKQKEALEHYQKAVSINPRYAEAHYNPRYAEAHYNLALLLGKRGQLHDAENHFRQALLLNPSDAESYNNLGLLFAMKGELEEAEAQFRKAILISPRYAKAYFNLGRISAQRGHLDDAVRHFTQALQIQPGVAEIHENLARALASQGKKEEALQHYQEALRITRSRIQETSLH